MKIRVVTNAAADLPEEILKEHNIAKIPHVVYFDDKEWKLDVDISTNDFYELLRTQKIIPPTSNPEPLDFRDVFESSFEEEGYDHIFCVTAAKVLGSSTYSAARMAAKQFKNKITLIDTESTSGVQGLIALNIMELAEKGKTVEQITQIIENLKKESYLIGGFHTLDNIYKSGRLESKFVLYLTKFLKIKPIVKMVPPGTLESRFPGLFLKRTIITRLKKMAYKDLERDLEYDMIVSHVENPKAANKIISEIKKKIKIKKCLITFAAPVVGTHTGWGTVLVSLLPSIEKEHAK
ncbi:MAG: DegV family protein [Asgard group archaeon]|nr:DegV family protein [Asgard group archaeon]